MTHPLIEKTWQSEGHPADEPVNYRLVHEQACLKFALQNPAERMSYLDGLAAIVATEDGTSLKSRSELFQVHRNLNEVHQKLLKLNR